MTPLPSRGRWLHTMMPSGVWRFEHIPSRSVIFARRDASEAEITRRLAEAQDTIARLTAEGRRLTTITAALVMPARPARCDTATESPAFPRRSGLMSSEVHCAPESEP